MLWGSITHGSHNETSHNIMQNEEEKLPQMIGTVLIDKLYVVNVLNIWYMTSIYDNTWCTCMIFLHSVSRPMNINLSSDLKMPPRGL